jgi:hypothetical protein
MKICAACSRVPVFVKVIWEAKTFTRLVVEAAAWSFEEDSQECHPDVCFVLSLARAVAHRLRMLVTFCPGEDVVFPDKEVPIAATIIDVVPTCSQIDALAPLLDKKFAAIMLPRCSP